MLIRAEYYSGRVAQADPCKVARRSRRRSTSVRSAVTQSASDAWARSRITSPQDVHFGTGSVWRLSERVIPAIRCCRSGEFMCIRCHWPVGISLTDGVARPGGSAWPAAWGSRATTCAPPLQQSTRTGVHPPSGPQQSFSSAFGHESSAPAVWRRETLPRSTRSSDTVNVGALAASVSQRLGTRSCNRSAPQPRPPRGTPRTRHKAPGEIEA